jgi:hypothetical protein
MPEVSEKTKLIIKCIEFYIDSITQNGSVCPSIEQMREIVKLDEIKTSLISPK